MSDSLLRRVTLRVEGKLLYCFESWCLSVLLGENYSINRDLQLFFYVNFCQRWWILKIEHTFASCELFNLTTWSRVRPLIAVHAVWFRFWPCWLRHICGRHWWLFSQWLYISIDSNIPSIRRHFDYEYSVVEEEQIRIYLYHLSFLRVAGAAGANPRWHWARGGVSLGQV